MAFSLLASCAFFYVAERQALINAKENIVSVYPEDAKIALLEKEVFQQERLLENRLASKYHSQWEKADENTEIIRKLSDEIIVLRKQRENAMEKARSESVTVTIFFTSIGDWLNTDVGFVRGIGYAFLSLFLEISSLAVISLKKYLSIVKIEDPVSDEEYDSESDERKEKDNQMNRLANDITTGKTEPVLRKILKMNYGLSRVDVSCVLTSLCEVQVLKWSKRNVYSLNPDRYTEGDNPV